MKELNFERFRNYFNKKFNKTYSSKDYHIVEVSRKVYKAMPKIGILSDADVADINYELSYVMDPLIHNESYSEILDLFDEKTS
jgi:hypothetical protein